MRTVITNYVKNCTDCNRYKASNTKPTGHLQIPIYYGQYEILDIGLRGDPLGGSKPNPLVREYTGSLTSGGSLGIHCFHEDSFMNPAVTDNECCVVVSSACITGVPIFDTSDTSIFEVSRIATSRGLITESTFELDGDSR